MNPTLPHAVTSIVLRFCEDVASPRSLAVAILLRNGEWDQLASLRTDPLHFLDEDSYWKSQSVTSLLRKLEELPTTFDRTKVAVDNFWLAEKECFRTNVRLEPFLFNGLNDPKDEAVFLFSRNVRKILTGILGRAPTTETPIVYDSGEGPNFRRGGFDGRFGPGATFGDKGRYTTVPDKMSSRPTLTSDAISFLFPWSDTAWARACASSEKDPEFVSGNRFTTVPKDCEKDRGIAVEPSINLFYQLGLGRAIRAKLKRAGSDLLFAQDVHRQVACEASISGCFATLDLSNASDTVSRNLVKLLIPHDWFEMLDALRSKKTLIDKKWVLLEKFSSMGNGFTFELETLIFSGLCLGVADALSKDYTLGRDIFVFGDDIIVPTDMATEVIAVLRFFGFSLNERKSFVSGPFRESCGGDYFRGVDVRPFFLGEIPNEPQHFIAMANGFRRLGLNSPGRPNRSHYLSRTWFKILDQIPSEIRRLRGPEGLGDLVIHDDEERWRYRWRDSIRYIQVWRPASYRKIGWGNFRPDVILASALYGVDSGSPEGTLSLTDRIGVIPRNSVTGYKLGWVAYS